MSPDADLVEFVRTIAKDPYLTFPDDGVDAVLSAIKRYAARSSPLNEIHQELMAKDYGLRKRGPGASLSLRTVRLMAFKLGVGVADILNGHCKWTGLLAPSWPIPKESLATYSRQRHSRDTIVEAMKAELARKRTKPPSFSMLAARLGVSEGCLRYCAPALSRRIIARYRAWVIDKRKRDRARANRAIKRLVNEDPSETHTRASAVRAVCKSACVSRRVARQEVQAMETRRRR